MVYLLHFDRPLSHASHLIVSTDREVRGPVTTVELLNADPSGLLYAALRHDVPFTVARTWHGGARIAARLKQQNNSARYCPTCRHASAATSD